MQGVICPVCDEVFTFDTSLLLVECPNCRSPVLQGDIKMRPANDVISEQ